MIAVGAREPLKCLEIQSNIARHWAERLLPAGKLKDNAMVKFLKSSANTDGVEQLTGKAIGEYNNRLKVRLRHDKPRCFQVIKKKYLCDDVTAPYTAAPEENTFQLGDVPYMLQERGKLATDPAMRLTWDFDTYQDLCINQPDFFNRELALALADLEKEINKDLIVQLSTAIGKIQLPNNTAVVSKSFPLLVPNTQTAVHSLNPQVDLEIRRAYLHARTQTKYAVFGGDNFYTYASMRGLSNMSAIGLDMSKSQADYPFLYDLDWDLVMGSNAFVSVPFGAMQLLQWNQNIGNGFIDYPDSKHFILTTPNGLKVDAFWQHDTKNGCNKISVVLKCYAEPVVLPGGGCDLDAAVNGIFKFIDCSTVNTVTC